MLFYVLAEEPSLPKSTSFWRPENIQDKQVHTQEGSHEGEDPLSRVAHCGMNITAG